MLVAGLHRLVASLEVFLLATSTVFLFTQGAGATVAADQDSSATDLCPAELLACNEDDICFGCISVTVSSSTEFKACDTPGASSPESSAICAEGRQAMCCIDELSEYDCMANPVYLQYVTCLLFESGCSTDDVSCDNEDDGDMSLDATQGGAGGSSKSSSSIASSSVFVTLTVAFVLFAAGVSVGVIMSTKFMPNSRSFVRIP